MGNRFQELRAKFADLRHGKPTRSLRIIAVAGPYGKTTTIRLLKGILREASQQVSLFVPDESTTVDTLFEYLADAKRRQDQVVIIELNDFLLRGELLTGVFIDTLILTAEVPDIEKLLELKPKHVIAPSNLEIPSGLVEPYQYISVGDDENAEAKIEDIKLYRKGTEVNLTIDNQIKLELATPLVGAANGRDVATAVAAAYVLGVDLSAAQEGIAEVEGTDSNFAWVPAPGAYDVVIDAANATDSVELVTEAAKEFAQRRLIIAYGDENPSTDVVNSLKKRADRLFIVGGAHFSNVDVTESAEDAYKKAIRSARQGDLLLLLGRKFSERVGATSYGAMLGASES